MTSHFQELNTGIKVVDEEHRILLAILEKLCSICLAQQEQCENCELSRREECDQALTGVLGELLKYMVEHFRHEEKILIGAPKDIREGHAAAHADMVEGLSKSMVSKVHRIPMVTPCEIKEQIEHWLTEHIHAYDLPSLRSMACRD